jgi:hypothetical protein
MSESASKSRARGSAPAPQRAPAREPSSGSAGARSGLPGLLQSAAPAMGLGVQRQVALSEPGDRFEREADAAADRVTGGGNVEPSAISPVTPDALAQTAPQEPAAVAQDAMPETAVQKAAAAPEKQPEAAVEKAAAAPEKKPEAAVQKKGSGPGPEEQKHPMDPVQKAAVKPEEKKPVQTDAAVGSKPAPARSMGAAASDAIASKGAGKPLEPSTRGTLESGLGTDLSGVRVHDNAAARSSAEALNARAFTHGSDIWLGPGESQNDTRLMAHEATHVVQQSGGVNRMVQRANGGAPGAGAVTPSTTTGANPAGATPAAGVLPSKAGEVIDVTNHKMLLPSLTIPEFKFVPLKSANYVTLRRENRTDQRQEWRDKLGPSVEPKAFDKLKSLPGIPKAKPSAGASANATGGANDPDKFLFFRLEPGKATDREGKAVGREGFLFGTPAELKREFIIPRWDRNGAARAMDVDHKEELQLGGSDAIENYQVLDGSANRSAGIKIHNKIIGSIRNSVKLHLGEAPFGKQEPSRKELETLYANYELTFKEIKGDATDNPAGFDAKWDKGQVEDVEAPLKALKVLSPQEVEANKLLSGVRTRLVLFPLASGGPPKNISWDADNRRPAPGIDFERDLGFKGLKQPVNMTYDDAAQRGNITGYFRPRRKSITPYPIGPILLSGVGNLPFACRMDSGSLLQSMRFASMYGLSAVEFSEATFDERGLYARGKVAPSLQILKKLPIDVVVEGDDVKLETTITADGLELPKPFKVTEGALVLSLGTNGPEAEGNIGIAIERLGEGRIGVKAGADGIELHGSFDFDKKTFDKARIEVHYVKDMFSASGEIGIPPGKINGIKSATIRAAYAKDQFSASGLVKPDIPAVEEAGLSIEYGEQTGLKFSGDLAIKKDTPGIEGGSIHIEALKLPGSEEFKVKGAGTAKPKIPGVDSELKVSYDDGTFDAAVTASYDRGRLKGSIEVGVTNRPTADGKPSGPAPEKGGDITVYGGGSLTIVLGPLQGTVGVHLLPNGEIEVAGELDLTTHDFPPAKRFDKNIFTLHIDIPILGITVPVVHTHIGIFATVEGGLDVNAGIGPGVLTGRLGVNYNPSHEENTKLWGKASLHVPADAGLRVFVSGGLGAGIPLVDATAKLTVGASLGLEGALDADVPVEWTPAKGLTLDPVVSIHAEPKLKVGVTGSVDVVFDTWLHTFHLYHHDWDLASFEYGSNLAFGVTFPMHYDESGGFDFSLDKVKFQVPDIKPKEILSDVISRIV